MLHCCRQANTGFFLLELVMAKAKTGKAKKALKQLKKAIKRARKLIKQSD